MEVELDKEAKEILDGMVFSLHKKDTTTILGEVGKGETQRLEKI